MDKITINLLSPDFKPLPIYFDTACANYKQEMLNRPNGCNFYQILFVTNGEGILECGGKKYILKKGCAFYTSQQVPVTYYSTNGLITAFLTIKGDGADKISKHFGCQDFLFRKSVNLEKYISQIKSVIEEYYNYKRQSVLSSLSYTFFIDFFEQNEAEPNLINKIALYIEKNFIKKLTLEKIADTHGISVSKLCHDFKKEFNCTVFEYILNLRLNYARNLLLSNPNAKTKDTALNCGFDDISYFCKAYKNKFGLTPTQDKK